MKKLKARLFTSGERTIVIFLVVLLTFITSVYSSGYIYQETVNSSTCNSGWPTPFVCSNTYDGDWGSYDQAVHDSIAIVWLNYIKPPNVWSNTKWLVKVCRLSPTNYSLSSCWNQSSTNVNLHIESWHSSGSPSNYKTKVYCDDPGGGLLFECPWSDYYSDAYVYEEGIYWDMSQLPDINTSTLVCTSCLPPNGDNSSPYNGSYTRPSFEFYTNEASNCSIGSHDWNYSKMNASRRCYDDGKFHDCTMKDFDKVTGPTNYTYISCIIQQGFELNTSTSGPLEMNIYPGYPTDLWIEVGDIDTVTEWNYSGEFNTSLESLDFSDSINDYLATCTADVYGYCNVPIYSYSTTIGNIEITDLAVYYTYDWNPVNINKSIIELYLNYSSGDVKVPLTIESTNGMIEISDIKYDYLGGNKIYNLTIHNSDYSRNLTYNLTYYYSDWSYKYPTNILNLDFYPSKPTSKNVVPFGQTNARPILNITSESYSNNSLIISMKINETNSCVNLIMGNKSNISSGISMTNLFSTPIKNFTSQENATNYSCVGNWAGFYPCSNSYDGLWHDSGNYDYSYCMPTSRHCQLYINYTKPETATRDSIWEVGFTYSQNYTIPYICWIQEPLRFLINVSPASGICNQLTSLYCYNGNTFITISNAGCNVIHEEKIHWNFPSKDGLSINYNNNKGIWMWADYSCNYSDWYKWEPEIAMKACCDNCDVCDNEVENAG